MSRQQAIDALRDKFPAASDGAWLVDEVDRLHRKSQVFFEQLDASVRAPHCGVSHREFVQALLLRAQEVGLYSPEKL